MEEADKTKRIVSVSKGKIKGCHKQEPRRMKLSAEITNKEKRAVKPI